MDVVVLRWPADEVRRARAADEGRPRLLLVDPGVAAPISADVLEDWVRLPATDDDIDARLDMLRARSVLDGNGFRLPDEKVPPALEDGVLRYGDRWVPLPPVEARLAQSLLDRMGAVVSRESLAKAGWPQGAPGRNALDVHMLRLRRRLDQVGLAIRTIRSRGYLLEPSGSRQRTVGHA